MAEVNGGGAAEAAPNTGAAGAAEAASGAQAGNNSGAAVERSAEAGRDTSATRARSLDDVLNNGTQEEISAMLLKAERGELGGEPEDSAEAEDGADTEGTIEDTGETEAGETEGAEAPEGSEVEGEREEGALPSRIQVKRFAVKDQLALIAAQDYVKQNPGKSLAEALAAVGFTGTVAAEAANKTDTTKTTETAEAKPDLGKKIEALEDELEKAMSEFDSKKARELNRQIRELESQRTTQTLKAEMAAETQLQAHEARVEETVAGITKVVPEFTQEGSALNVAVNQIVETLPDSFFADPGWPRKALALAWQEVNPDKPMPALSAAKAAVAAKAVPLNPKQGNQPAIVPKVAVRKPAGPASVLSTGNRAQDDSGVMARAMRPEATDAEIRAAIRLAEQGKAA